MTRFQTELQRLFLPPDALPIRLGEDLAPLLRASGHARAAVLSLARPADWDRMLRVWQGVQTDLGLPAPGIAVNGTDGYQLWFSLQEPVSEGELHAFLEGLQARYLGDIAPRRVALWPCTDAHGACTSFESGLRVAASTGPERWSAFVTPDLARIFSGDPWLDMAPADASQADVLAHLVSARPDVFDTACARLIPGAVVSPAYSPEPSAGVAPPPPVAPQHYPPFDRPEAFLRQVMNDSTVALALRIEAAKALLAHASQQD